MLCTRQWVRERVQYWWTKLQEQYLYDDSIPSKMWMGIVPRVQFSNRMTSTAGLAYTSYTKECRVKFSLFFMETVPQHEYDPTIAHEVAHIWADKMLGSDAKHGWSWKQVMRAIGQKPDVCHTYDSKPRKKRAKVRIYCGCEGGTLMGRTQYNRLLRGKNYTCRKCNCRCSSDILTKALVPFNKAVLDYQKKTLAELDLTSAQKN